MSLPSFFITGERGRKTFIHKHQFVGGLSRTKIRKKSTELGMFPIACLFL
jgi:hypothetical protein